MITKNEWWRYGRYCRKRYFYKFVQYIITVNVILGFINSSLLSICEWSGK